MCEFDRASTPCTRDCREVFLLGPHSERQMFLYHLAEWSLRLTNLIEGV